MNKTIEELRKLRHVPAHTDEQRKENRAINLVCFQLNAGMTITHGGKDVICQNKDAVITDESQHRIVSVNTLTHNVYIKQNPVATFYTLYRAVEYVALLKGLI
jgi:hypothetical protein